MQKVQNMKAMALDNIIAVQSAGSSKAAGKSGDFQKLMDNSSKTSKNVEPVKVVTDTKVSNDNKVVADVTSGQEDYNVSRQSGTEQSVVSESDIAAVEQAVKDVIRSILHIDDAALEAVMSEMGISLLQLLDPAVLQDFMMNLNPGTDVMDFLTSEAMLGDFTELMQSLEDIDWEGLIGMSKEEFVQALEDMPEQELTEGMLEFTAPTEEAQESDINTVTAMPETEPEKNAVMNQTVEVKEQKSPDAVKNVGTQEAVTAEESQMVTATGESGDAGENAAQSQFSQRDSQGILRDTRPADNPVVTMMDFVENMMQATEQVQTGDVVKMQQMIDIVNQVVEKIHSSVQEDTTSMEMQLNPESLGKVLLSVSNRNGVMTASFTVQTQEAKEALESQMYQLRDNLEQKNLKVEAVEVSVSDFTFNQSSQADTGDQKDFSQGHGKRMRFEPDDEEDEEEVSRAEAERVRRSVMRDSGSSVDYTA